jgi:hypothetical protein
VIASPQKGNYVLPKDLPDDCPEMAEHKHYLLDPEFHELFNVPVEDACQGDEDVAGDVVERVEDLAADAEVVTPRTAPATAAKKARRPINPRSSQQRASNVSRSPGPRYATYDGTADYLRHVDRVIPALVYRQKVSVDRVSDGWHLLIIATNARGQTVYLLSSRRGVVPVVPLDEPENAQDRDGRTLTFGYTTVVPPYLQELRLTSKDRSRIVAGILGEFMDPVSSDYVWASRRWPF